MKHTFIYLIFILIQSFTLLHAQAIERDSSICIASSDIYRMGGRMVVSMQVDVTRTIPSNEAVVLTPQLQDSLSNFVNLPSIFINGRKQHIVFQRENEGKKEDYEAVRRINGNRQTVHYLRSVPFSAWMRHATLSLIEKECGCGVPHRTDSTYLTTLRIMPDVQPLLAFVSPEVEQNKQREESGSAFLDFPLNEAKILPNFRNNAVELQKIMHSIDLVKNDTNVSISHIEIHGFASPEGPYAINERLSRERTQALKEYVCGRYAFNDSLFIIRHTAEDWEGLAKLINDTVFDKQKELLEIVLGADAPDLKEKKIRKQYPKLFQFMLKNWMPSLRRSDYTIHYTVRPFTVEQAKVVFREQPKNLSIEEMFRIAQTYPVGGPEYCQLFRTAVLLNPENPVANLNAACIALEQKDTVSAGYYLEKAPECAEKTLAQGVLHMLRGEYSAAEAKLQEAEKAGLSQATENLKLLHEFF